jgi:hypothetical protein
MSAGACCFLLAASIAGPLAAVKLAEILCGL